MTGADRREADDLSACLPDHLDLGLREILSCVRLADDVEGGSSVRLC